MEGWLVASKGLGPLPRRRGSALAHGCGRSGRGALPLVRAAVISTGLRVLAGRLAGTEAAVLLGLEAELLVVGERLRADERQVERRRERVEAVERRARAEGDRGGRGEGEDDELLEEAANGAARTREELARRAGRLVCGSSPALRTR